VALRFELLSCGPALSRSSWNNPGTEDLASPTPSTRFKLIKNIYGCYSVEVKHSVAVIQAKIKLIIIRDWRNCAFFVQLSLIFTSWGILAITLLILLFTLIVACSGSSLFKGDGNAYCPAA